VLRGSTSLTPGGSRMPLFEIYLNSVNLRIGGETPGSHIPHALDLAQSGRVTPGKLVSHVLDWEALPDARPTPPLPPLKVPPRRVGLCKCPLRSYKHRAAGRPARGAPLTRSRDPARPSRALPTAHSQPRLNARPEVSRAGRSARRPLEQRLRVLSRVPGGACSESAGHTLLGFRRADNGSLALRVRCMCHPGWTLSFDHQEMSESCQTPDSPSRRSAWYEINRRTSRWRRRAPIRWSAGRALLRRGSRRAAPLRSRR
jgi:hypothetical protein